MDQSDFAKRTRSAFIALYMAVLEEIEWPDEKVTIDELITVFGRHVDQQDLERVKKLFNWDEINKLIQQLRDGA